EHLTLFHQDRDHVAGRLGHAVGQFLDGDRLGDNHFAAQLLFWFCSDLTLAPLDAATEGGVGALAFLVHFLGGHHGKAGTTLLLAGAARRSRCGRGPGRAAARPARADRRFLLFRFERGGARSECAGEARLRLLFTKALLGDLAGLLLGLLVV